ncbi:kelch domain-containing protein 3 [Borealophlyctis nickersoniae]|nr:kelch domain-containing protein 3 [Borealophlyctis nickersoniae]
MLATSNRIITLTGHMSLNDEDLALDANLTRRQTIVSTSVSAMDYGTGKTADYTVTPLNDTFNPLNTYGAACAYDASSKLIHCWGGREVSQVPAKVYNTLSSFDTTAMKWVRVAEYPEVPGYMGSASAVVDSSLYMYGGSNTSDFYRIDLKSYALSRVTATGVSPGSRKDHCMATLSDTKFIMQGGTISRSAGSAEINTNQVHIFDTQTNSWSDVTPSNATTAPLNPSARFGSGCVVGQNGGFYIFGGSDGSRRNDLWVLEPPQRQWKRLTADTANIPNLPDTRYYTRLLSLGRFLITYGGANAQIGNSSTRVAYDANLYFFDTEKSEWISSTTFLNDPWFKSFSNSGESNAGADSHDGGGANIGAIAGGAVAGIVVLIAAVAGVLVVIRRRNAVKANGVPAASYGAVPPPPVMHGLDTPEYHV